MNDLVIFVAPGGTVAEEWSELAQAPATEAELSDVIEREVPGDHHVALVQLVDGGRALLHEPGGEAVRMNVVRSADDRIRFGMRPSGDATLWLAAGVVAASGFDIVGYSLEAPASIDAQDPIEGESQHDPEPTPSPGVAPEPDDGATVRPTAAPSDVTQHFDVPTPVASPDEPEVFQPPPPGTPAAIIPPVVSAPPPGPPPVVASVSPPPAVSPPVVSPPPPSYDPPVVATGLFPGLPEGPVPTEDEPVVADPPPPPIAAESAGSVPVVVRFDDGQEVALDQTLAIGRAPEGSDHVPPGAVIVVVSGEQVSRCHVIIRPAPDGAEAIDANSLNGCYLDSPDRPGTGPQLPVGVPVPIEPGQTLRFGDRSLTVLGRSSQ